MNPVKHTSGSSNKEKEHAHARTSLFSQAAKTHAHTTPARLILKSEHQRTGIFKGTALNQLNLAIFPIHFTNLSFVNL